MTKKTVLEEKTSEQKEIIEPQKPSPLQKIKRVNALTSCLTNKNFLEAIKYLDENEYILEIFAKAIETELENMFNNGQINNAINLAKTIDIAYQKANAMANSPLQQVLEKLLENLGGTQNSSLEIKQNEHISHHIPSRRGELMGF